LPGGSRGLGDVYKRQAQYPLSFKKTRILLKLAQILVPILFSLQKKFVQKAMFTHLNHGAYFFRIYALIYV
jgi:hypothetical protein